MTAILTAKVPSTTGGSVEHLKLRSVCPSGGDATGVNAQLVQQLNELENNVHHVLANQALSDKFAPQMLNMLRRFTTGLQDLDGFADSVKHFIRPPLQSFDAPPTPPAKKQDCPLSGKETEVTGSANSVRIPLDMSAGAKAVANKVLEKLDVVDEPIALVDLAKVKTQHAKWARYLPHVTPFYAVKCNPDPMILRTLDSQGANFDCASKQEIETVLALGVAPDRIVFSVPCKPRSHLQYAKDIGIDLTVFDNAEELKKISEVFPTARLLLRLRCEDACAQCPLSMKYGAGSNIWLALLKEVKRLGLRLVGVSFHVGSGCQTPGTFNQALDDAKRIFTLATELGLPSLTVLDIGGGFPGDDDSSISFPGLAASISQAIHASFSDEELGAMNLIAEPGRFYAMQSTSLLTKVIAKATIPPSEEDSEGVEKIRYYLNDGLYGSFNCVLYDHATVRPVVLHDASGRNAHAGPLCSLFGPTCDGFDTIEANVTYLPELYEGEWLLWPNMGAYTSAAGSTFNGFPMPMNWYYESVPEHNCVIALCDVDAFRSLD